MRATHTLLTTTLALLLSVSPSWADDQAPARPSEAKPTDAKPTDAKPEAAKPVGEPRAADLLAKASANRYLWQPTVSAVIGQFTWTVDGKSVSGSFRRDLRSRTGSKFDCADAAVASEAQAHIWSLIMHRAPRAGGAGREPSPAKVLVEDDARGPLIVLLDDDLESAYRVRDGKLVQVNRTMGERRFTIDVGSFHTAEDGRTLPLSWSTTWWDRATGKRLEIRSVKVAAYQAVAGQLFPTAEMVTIEKDGRSTTVEIRYSDVAFEQSAAPSR